MLEWKPEAQGVRGDRSASSKKVQLGLNSWLTLTWTELCFDPNWMSTHYRKLAKADKRIKDVY